MPRTMSRHAFFAVSALLFAATAAVTVASCTSMTMTSMPDASWGENWVAFAGMWVVMMTAMMLPSLAPLLWRYRETASRAGAIAPDGLAALAGLAYLLVWALLGAIVFPLDAGLSLLLHATMQGRAALAATGVAVAASGLYQFTSFKTRHLACCREERLRGMRVEAYPHGAWRYGLNLGVDCALSSTGFTLALLVVGVMDLRAMTLAAAAITAERLMPAGNRVAYAIGIAAVGAGLCLCLKATMGTI